jgi:hypothetical protein
VVRLYDFCVPFLSGLLAGGIELAIGQGCCRVRGTMPADLAVTPSYRVMNADRLGIPAEKAERAAWRATEVYRVQLAAGFVLLATVPPPPERAGGWSMLVMAYDPQDGTGTELRGAWWLGPEFPAHPVKAFSRFVARFGSPLATPAGRSVFCLACAGEIPPQPTGRADQIDLHALRQASQSGETAGWAWCFGINVSEHRAYLQAMEAAGQAARHPSGRRHRDREPGRSRGGTGQET